MRDRPSEPPGDSRVKAPSPAVGRAFRILRLLATTPAPLGVSQIAAALDLGKATVHALVHALAGAGALEQTPEKKYSLGPLLEELAASRTGIRSLETVCRPLLEDLATDLQQTAIMGVPEGDRLRIVAVVEGGGEVRIGATPGHRLPLSAGAHGKIVAAWPQQSPRAGAPSPGDRAGSEAQDVRRAGVAYDRGEYLEGVVAAAAPVLDPAGGLAAVMYVVGLRDLVGEAGLADAGRAVRRAVDLATQALRS